MIDFNNQQIDDPIFSDRDIRVNNPSADVSWTHNLSTELSGTVVNDLVLNLAIGGIQDGNPILGPFDDKLFIENIEVLGAFDNLNQGLRGTRLLTFSLTPEQITSFQTDYQLDIFIDGGIVPSGWRAAGAIESYFIDYSEVNVNAEIKSSPEPSTIIGVLFACSMGIAMRKKPNN